MGTGAHFPDYEKIGVNDDALYVSGNYFPIVSGTGVYAGLTAIEKAPLLSGGPANIVYSEFFDAFSVFPLNQYDSGGTQYFAEAIGSGVIRIHSVTDVLTSPTRNTFDLTVPAYDEPVTVPQLSGQQNADAVSGRIMTGVWRDGSAWFAHGIRDPAIGDGENVARWYEVATNDFPNANPTLVQSGNVDPGPDIYAWMPAIAVDGAGNMGIGFAMGGPNMHLGAGYTGRLASDPVGQTKLPVQELAAGEGGYQIVSGSRNRWGDYTGLAVDPADDSTFWVFNEYATDSNRWSTRIGSFEIDPIPDTDFYSIAVNMDDNLDIEVLTPFDGADDVQNDLDALVELYDPDGIMVASNSGGPSQNPSISIQAQKTGEYSASSCCGSGSRYIRRPRSTVRQAPIVVRRLSISRRTMAKR